MSVQPKMSRYIPAVMNNMSVCVDDRRLSVLLCVLAFSELSMSVFSGLEGRAAVLSEYQSTVLKH